MPYAPDARDYLTLHKVEETLKVVDKEKEHAERELSDLKNDLSCKNMELARLLTLNENFKTKLEELEAVKRSFGSHNVPCPHAVLERALVMPHQAYRPDVGFGGTVPRLLINPFYDPEGGTKKKGRAGRGRKKK